MATVKIKIMGFAFRGPGPDTSTSAYADENNFYSAQDLVKKILAKKIFPSSDVVEKVAEYYATKEYTKKHIIEDLQLNLKDELKRYKPVCGRS